MKSNTRYIITAGAVALGLFAVGATANAIAGTANPGSDANSLGDPVVVPGDPSPSGTLEEIQAEPEDLQPSLDPTFADPGFTFDTTGSAPGDDDDDHEDDHGGNSGPGGGDDEHDDD